MRPGPVHSQVNTADYLLEAVDDRRVALITEAAQFTYADIRQAAARLAGELDAAGLRPGDRVGLLARNSLFWVGAYLAGLKLGAIVVPFATTITSDDLALQLRLAGCGRLCVERAVVRRFRRGLSAETLLISDEVLEQAGPSTWPEHATIDRDDVDAALMFTSGTTALPRAVRVTHRNIQANTNSIIEYLGLTSAERILVVLPFYYCFGTSLLHTHLRAGGTLVLSNTFTYPETTLALMEAQACTGFAGVPSVYQSLLRNSSFSRRSWPALRKLQQAGGKLASGLIGELQAAVPHAEIYVMYGQTEATARLAYLPPALLATKLGSIGQAIPGVELRVVGEGGAEVRPGEVGEIVARGDNISPGYWQDPEASAEKFEDGALRTGDLATLDEDGYVYIVDRKSDFIKSYGYRVSSQQVEACILELPEVVAAAVVGEPDRVRGEAILGYVTLRAGARLRPEAIVAHCAARLAKHMVPRAVTILERLPMNSQGKVLKTALRGRAAQPVLAGGGNPA
jgi:acyl-CoA synthetase (AMP-forming)/AMP-acid ligase II